jgi:hypothetical protein
MSQLVFERQERSLRRIRNAKYPSCSTIEELHNLLTNNEQVRNEFGTFNGENFYETTLSFEDSKASIFVFRPVVQQMELFSDVFIDGTFNILPLNYKQLLIILAEVQGRVSF